MLNESIVNTLLKLNDQKNTLYNLGSQSEGTTTLGLSSDFDQVICLNIYNVIQDWRDWQPGVQNLLMIQDDTVSPGYCLLQCLRQDVPLPYNDVPNDVPNEYFFRDRTGRILLRNKTMSEAAQFTATTIAATNDTGGARHGPAYTQQRKRVQDIDIVGALPCKTWSLQAKQWLDWQSVGQWPSNDIKRYCSNTGCFVVGVGSKGSENHELEWRISTSLAERCLMFNLNITQIRCYVLMKMILKTYIKPHCEDSISSFMCKTVLFQLTEITHCNFWRETNLLVCLSVCLCVLYNSVLNENCPHFIIPGNNLMVGQIVQESKPHILEILQYIINSEGTTLLGIKCDALGARLQLKLNHLCLYNLCPFKTIDISVVSGNLLRATATMLKQEIDYRLAFIRNTRYEVAIQTLMKYIFKLIISNQSQGLDKTACSLLAPWFCSTLGSILVSLNIQQHNGISAEAFNWISLGLNTDVASNKLKLASSFYCIEDYHRTEIVLTDIEGNYDLNIVEPTCDCFYYFRQAHRGGFNAVCDNHTELALQYATAFCVRFLPFEVNCIPTELQYEIFRSTQEDLAFGGRTDYWMDWAVVDALPYLYFLQYKTYSYLRRQDDKQRALSSLIRTIDQEPNLGHRETALNLLGQCIEQENCPTDALCCYLVSLDLRGRNNAARIHICRFLSAMVNDQVQNQSLL
ncbi:uncharacterized protein LOC128559145 [Mercenaria mercenaria]|uniref:uncharacterized protein LOC128559145 n=1 Tax=Mercenaria mercenaria TaxID=6596 RepID=UPI00234F4BCA|nr:uncharacterized protein LOC128559145 [Mercenaria mercenaria]